MVARVERVTARILVAVAACAGALLAWRAWKGPFQLGPLWIRSPFTLEAVFALSVGGLLAIACGRRADAESIFPRWTRLPLLFFALVLTVLAFAPNLHDPFLSDDYILTTHATLVPAVLARTFVTPGGDGAFRPLGHVWFGLIHSFAGTNPLPWHCCSLLLHLLNCALLFALAGALWENPLLSFTSAFLFGLHGTRVETVVWTAANFDLLACAFSFAAALCVLRPQARRSRWAVVLALVLLIAAILCKESAYATPIVILGLAEAAGRLRDRTVREFLAGSVAVCVAMFAWRWCLFRGPGGYIDPSTGQPAILSLRLIGSLKAVFVRLWTILLFPINWTATGSAWLAAAVLLGCAAVVFLLWASGGLRPWVVLSLLGTTACAMVPVLHLALVGESLLGARIFYLPAVPFFILAGHAVASVASRRRAILGLAALAFSTVMMLEHNLAFWHRAALVADRVCTAAAGGGPVSPTSYALPGILSFGNGFRECVELKHAK